VGARSILSRAAGSGLRMGRGTADHVVRLAGPPLARLTGTVVSRIRRPQPHTTATFTPSRRRAAGAPGPARPSPATVARNVGPPRPTAKQPRATKATSGPGAKLPPPRSSTS
jgi:hypothetical protein